MKNSKLNILNSTKFSFKYLVGLHTEAKHSLSVSVIYTDAPTYHDGDVNNFAPTAFWLMR